MLGMRDLPSGLPDSRNDQPCHEMAVVLWDCCSAPCRVSLGMFGYPKIVTRAGACWRARRAMPNRFTVILERLVARPHWAASTWLGQLGPGDKRATLAPDS